MAVIHVKIRFGSFNGTGCNDSVSVYISEDKLLLLSFVFAMVTFEKRGSPMSSHSQQLTMQAYIFLVTTQLGAIVESFVMPISVLKYPSKRKQPSPSPLAAFPDQVPMDAGVIAGGGAGSAVMEFVALTKRP